MKINPIEHKRCFRLAFVSAVLAASATGASAQQVSPVSPALFGAITDPAPASGAMDDLLSQYLSSVNTRAFGRELVRPGFIKRAGIVTKQTWAPQPSAIFAAATAAFAAAQQQGVGAPPATLPLQTQQENPASWNVSLGGDVSPGGYGFFLGATHALNGDFGSDGFLVRTSVSAGKYEEGSARGISHVAYGGVNFLLGYQHAAGRSQVRFFAGPEYVHNGPGASPGIRGGSWDLRLVAEAAAPVGQDLDVTSYASYSTFENQYLAQGRLLYRTASGNRFGPEASISGGDTWEQYRVGGHADLATAFGAIGFSTGYAWNERTGSNEGLYANAILSINF
jgi:hypothetical protein